MIASHGLDKKAAAPVIKCVNYLVQNTRWLHHDRALADGLPIATGVIEGACRYLVQDRMGRTGARWSLGIRCMKPVLPEDDPGGQDGGDGEPDDVGAARGSVAHEWADGRAVLRAGRARASSAEPLVAAATA